jgi:hypothetical protein
MKPTTHALLIALALATCVVAAPLALPQAPSADGWQAIAGSWNATGHRQSVPTGGDRNASTAYLSGAVTLTASGGTSRGFQGEAITFDEGAGTGMGRAVWTDERGDKIFSRLTGDLRLARRRIVGTITGGTGRYAGIEGDYSFEWQYLIQSEDGTVQGQAVDLTGRARSKGAAR